MNSPWAICIALEDAPSLAVFRLAPGIELAADTSSIWLRGHHSDERLDAKLAGLPAHARYEWLPPDQLRRIDRRIPDAKLPPLSWQPLVTWLRVETPTSAFPATFPAAVPLRLVRSAEEREPELLLARWDDFKGFVANAAQLRLERLQFAADGEGNVLVRGRPLPPLPGRRFVLHGGVAVLAGFSWQPLVTVAALVRRFGASDENIVLWNEDGSFERVHREQFIPVSRSALRETTQALNALK